MSEFKERQFEEEVSENDLKRQIIERFEDLWTKFKWQCRKEISFTEQPIKPGRLALVQKRPRDLMNSEETFKALFILVRTVRNGEKLLICLIF